MSENKLALVRGSTPLLVVTLPDEIQPSDVYDGIITISQSKFDVAITRQLSDMQFDEGTKTYSSFITQAETLQLKSGRLTTIQVKLCDNADVVLVSYLYQVEVLPVNNEHVISTDNPSGQPYEVPLNNGVSFCPDVMAFKPQIDLTDVITTGDYRLLSHKPSIGGVTLIDDVSLSDLSLYSKEEVDTIIENALDAVDARDDEQDTRMDGIDTRLDNQIGDFVLNRTVLANEYTNSEIDNALNGKVDKVAGKQLSTEDYTTAEKTKLADLPSDSELDNLLNGKVDKETGKGLSTNDYTTAEKDKLTALPTKAELDTSLDTKVDKVAGKQLSTEDYTTAEKTKLAGIETGAQVNTVTGVKGDSETEYRTGNINITKANIGLGNVDNTSDADKPVSTAAQTALDGKVDKVTGKQLSTEDYTSAEKTKLGALPDADTLNADLANKQDTLTWDATPTEGSNNPVRSGGIYTALDGKLDASELNGVAQDATGLELVASMELEAVLIDNLFQTVFNSLPSDERCLEIYDELVIGNSYLDLLVTELRKKEAENA